MRPLRLLMLFATFLLVVGLAVPAVAALPEGVMTPAEVITIDRALDGSAIMTQGEAIGERIRAHGGGWWINILHEGSALGIWVPDELSETVGIYGDYQHNGDVVRVAGVVNVACATHAGEFDVHASSLAVIESGGPRDNPVQLWKGVIGLGGLILALILWRSHRQRRDRRML
jgi:hypothetical protein